MGEASDRRVSEPAILGGTLVVAAFLLSFGALHYGVFTKNVLLDTPLYERYGDAIVHGGQIPYRDFGLEYPPAALVVFAAPSLIAAPGDFSLYARLFEALMLACGAAASGLVAFVLVRQQAGTARMVAGTLLAGLAPLALGPVVLSRFDLWPAALTIAALAALIADHRRSAFALLAVGVAAKLYPIVLFPLAFVYVWRLNGRREALRASAVFAVVLLAWCVPFVVASPSGVWASFSGQASRPLQIESLGASFLLASHQLWGLALSQVNSHGSDNLGGGAASAFASVQSLLSVGLLLALWIAFARGGATRDRLLRYAAAAVCGFIAFDKVLSPQYLIWLFPLVPLVRGRRGLAAGALFLAAMVLTQMWFPRDYLDLVYGLAARPSWFVLARDLTLVALLLTLVWPERVARRAGVGLVAALALGAGGVATVALATPSPPYVPRHSGLLTETGVASTCAATRSAPSVSPGSVAYDVFNATRPATGASCVTVELDAGPHTQLFSASYRGGFDPSNPRAHYLGDAGVCTNVSGLTGARIGYSLNLAAGERFAVEVEACAPGTGTPTYRLDVHDGSSPPVDYRSAGASRSGGEVDVEWSTSSEAAGVSFRVYRDQGGARTPVGVRALPGTGSGSYQLRDLSASTSSASRYWILARAPRGRWSWYGPITIG